MLLLLKNKNMAGKLLRIFYDSNDPMTIYGFDVEYVMEEGANNGFFEPTMLKACSN